MSDAGLSLAEYQSHAARSAGSVLDFGADRKVGLTREVRNIKIGEFEIMCILDTDTPSDRVFVMVDDSWFKYARVDMNSSKYDEFMKRIKNEDSRNTFIETYKRVCAEHGVNPLAQRPKIENCGACASHAGGSESQCEWCGGTGLVLEQVKKAWRFWISPVDVYRPSTLKVPDGR